jgi:hypothetical protein
VYKIVYSDGELWSNSNMVSLVYTVVLFVWVLRFYQVTTTLTPISHPL